jgi:hypothetical protein
MRKFLLAPMLLLVLLPTTRACDYAPQRSFAFQQSFEFQFRVRPIVQFEVESFVRPSFEFRQRSFQSSFSDCPTCGGFQSFAPQSFNGYGSSRSFNSFERSSSFESSFRRSRSYDSFSGFGGFPGVVNNININSGRRGGFLAGRGRERSSESFRSRSRSRGGW